MKEIKLTEQQYSEIRSNAINNWIIYGKGNNANIISIINSFIGFCNYNGYIVRDGKVLTKDEKEE